MHLGEEPVEPARGLPWGFSAVPPASPSCAPPPLRYLCQRRGSGSASRAGSGCTWRQMPIPSRCVCLSASQELLVVGFVVLLFLFFSAIRWLFYLPPCLTPKGAKAAPAARSEMPLPSSYKGDAAFPQRGCGRASQAGNRAMGSGLVHLGDRCCRNPSASSGRQARR